ncbi:unnamed protein product [Menidia menidia]|uniref:(Atlantic silverside) hypothetical protein n=1 Tax=Menidia menidia TaxID=238744 RepID=A0A8S4AN38_9TELE|nr:unnamed protein product [Menidia menidia]
MSVPDVATAALCARELRQIGDKLFWRYKLLEDPGKTQEGPRRDPGRTQEGSRGDPGRTHSAREGPSRDPGGIQEGPPQARVTVVLGVCDRFLDGIRAGKMEGRGLTMEERTRGLGVFSNGQPTNQRPGEETSVRLQLVHPVMSSLNVNPLFETETEAFRRHSATPTTTKHPS